DLTLPKATVTRLAKSVLPPQTAIQKAALTALNQGGTVFVNYLTSTANEIARGHGRKGINANDVIEALKACEFGEFVPRIEKEL
ncbi:histone-fold-containing protein, partial [Wilcoxina mikolae CBS 423.85]